MQVGVNHYAARGCELKYSVNDAEAMSAALTEKLKAEGFDVTRNQVLLTTPIKSLGLHTLPIQLHPEIDVPITVNVARSQEEAERQARGEAIASEQETTMDELGLEVGQALADNDGSFDDR